MKVGTLILRDHCGGAALFWQDRPAGQALQGWYQSRTKARKAQKLVPDTQLDLSEIPKVLE